jgi:hypothetical protein
LIINKAYSHSQADRDTGAIAAIRDNIPNAQIVGGAGNGCNVNNGKTVNTLGFAVALGEDLANYNGAGRNLLWDYTNLHWGMYVMPPDTANNCGLPSNFDGVHSAYKVLNAIGKPIFVDEIDISNSNDSSYDTAAGNEMTAFMTDLQAHTAATSTEPGIVAGLLHELYQFPASCLPSAQASAAQTDEFLYTYPGCPAASATTAPQGTVVQQWVASH